MTAALSIGPAAADKLREALQLVFRDLDQAGRDQYVSLLEEGLRAGDKPVEGVIEARREGGLVGAILEQQQPGKAAVIWPPRLTVGEPASTAADLLNAATELAAQQGMEIAQVIVAAARQEDDAALRQAGYEPLAELLYLISEEDVFPRTSPAEMLQFEPSSPANRQRLVGILEATYEGTLDCPQLNGVRDSAEVLEGYRATGVFDPARWLIVRHQQRDVGCLLLADHPGDNMWELVYMGLSAPARGHGWGVETARYAQWLTAQAGRPRLIVGVDAANVPAVRMYDAAGYREWDRRRVYLKRLGQ